MEKLASLNLINSWAVAEQLYSASLKVASRLSQNGWCMSTQTRNSYLQKACAMNFFYRYMHVLHACVARGPYTAWHTCTIHCKLSIAHVFCAFVFILQPIWVIKLLAAFSEAEYSTLTWHSVTRFFSQESMVLMVFHIPCRVQTNAGAILLKVDHDIIPSFLTITSCSFSSLLSLKAYKLCTMPSADGVQCCRSCVVHKIPFHHTPQ